MSTHQRLIDLGRPRRIWAVGAVHGQRRKLVEVHDRIGASFRPGDRLIYLGNLLGYGEQVGETVDEVLVFRRSLMAIPGVVNGDIVFLRGRQEEMWQKFLQLHFAPSPIQVFRWALRQGVAATLAAYGGRADDGEISVRDGAVSANRWTAKLRRAVLERPGHDSYLTALRRAAYTVYGGSVGADMPATWAPGMLFVSAGVDPSRSLTAQGDALWWGCRGFNDWSSPYAGYRKVVRGFDPDRGGFHQGEHTITLDGGCGFGGSLIAACFSPDGEMLDRIVVGEKVDAEKAAETDAEN